MSLVHDVIEEYRPDFWLERDYVNTSCKFYQFIVSKASIEYANVKENFERQRQGFSVTQIERIQHGFAYASFKINYFYNDEPKTNVKYIKGSNNMKRFIGRNCDERVRDGFANGVFIQVEVLPNSCRDSAGAWQYPKYIIKAVNIDQLSNSFNQLKFY